MCFYGCSDFKTFEATSSQGNSETPTPFILSEANGYANYISQRYGQLTYQNMLDIIANDSTLGPAHMGELTPYHVTTTVVPKLIIDGEEGLFVHVAYLARSDNPLRYISEQTVQVACKYPDTPGWAHNRAVYVTLPDEKILNHGTLFIRSDGKLAVGRDHAKDFSRIMTKRSHSASECKANHESEDPASEEEQQDALIYSIWSMTAEVNRFAENGNYPHLEEVLKERGFEVVPFE